MFKGGRRWRVGVVNYYLRNKKQLLLYVASFNQTNYILIRVGRLARHVQRTSSAHGAVLHNHHNAWPKRRTELLHPLMDWQLLCKIYRILVVQEKSSSVTLDLKTPPSSSAELVCAYRFRHSSKTERVLWKIARKAIVHLPNWPKSIAPLPYCGGGVKGNSICSSPWRNSPASGYAI